MRPLIILAFVLASFCAYADGVFVATDGHAECKSYVLTSSHSTVACADVGTNRYYRVIVTDGEYVAGWSALPQARKDAAQAAAEAERTDFALRFDRLLKAFALVTLDEINVLRVKAGLAPRTVEQLKTAVRNKYQEIE